MVKIKSLMRILLKCPNRLVDVFIAAQNLQLLSEILTILQKLGFTNHFPEAVLLAWF